MYYEYWYVGQFEPEKVDREQAKIEKAKRGALNPRTIGRLDRDLLEQAAERVLGRPNQLERLFSDNGISLDDDGYLILDLQQMRESGANFVKLVCTLSGARLIDNLGRFRSAESIGSSPTFAET